MATFGTSIRLVLGLFLLAPFAWGATITQVGGAYAGFGYTISSTNGLAISWTQSGSYTDVDVFAHVLGRPASQAGTAYLMTAIGPGTTTASEVASAPFIAPSNLAEVHLFSGLSLGPGKYFLLLSSAVDGDDDFILWGESNARTYTHAPNVVQAPGYDFYGGPSGPYPPANTFNAFHFADTEPLYRVTGDAVATPEPASIGMAVLALLILAVKMRGVRQRA